MPYAGGQQERECESGGEAPPPSLDGAGPEETPAALEAYARRHRAALDAMGSVPLRAQRYFVVEAGSWGLGNRLSALVSGLALALATNRTLLVRDWFAFPSRLGELFTAPVGLGGWEGLSYERMTTRLEAAGVGAAEPR